MLTEVSFALPGLRGTSPEPVLEPDEDDDGARGKRQLDLFGAAATEGEEPAKADAVSGSDSDVDNGDGTMMILEGVIDLAFRERGGWVVADYKTDVGTDPDFPAREAAYRRQVDLYADAWARLTGEPVKERVLFFTAQGRVEQW